MIQRASWLLLCLLLLASCRGTACRPAATPSATPQRTGTAAGFEWAILPVGPKPAFYSDWSYHRADARAVREALRRVRGHLVAQFKVTFPPEEADTETWHEMVRGVLDKVPSYKCQAIGVVDEGRRLLYLNFVYHQELERDPDDDPEDPRDIPDWTTEPYMVSDGGDWFWQVLYDPRTRTFERLNINGEA